ncbi:enoyl-CoA hydratase/carnithine racemase, partial [Paraphaeosphaeria sporulosa]
ITLTKVTPSYWRASFSSPPFNIQTNAWYTALYTLITDLTTDPAVKVVVFDSSVPDFYIAHFDLLSPVDNSLIDGFWPNITQLANLPVLSVAAVNGIAHGGGAEFAAAMDVRFASREKAVFGQLEVGLGSLPGGGGLSLLPRLVGRSIALEIVLGGQDFDADTAAAYGWVNRAIPDAEFDGFIDTFARRVSSFDKSAILEAKRIINKRAGYPTVDEQAEDWNAALGLLATPNVQARVAKMVELGLQKDTDYELNVAEKLLDV